MAERGPLTSQHSTERHENTVRLTIGAGLLPALAEAAARLSLSLPDLVLAAARVLSYKYTGQSDSVGDPDRDLARLPEQRPEGLHVWVERHASGAEVRLTHDGRLGTDVSAVAQHLRRVLSQIAEQPRRPVRDIDLLPATQRQLILGEFNATASPYPRHASIAQLFAEQVTAGPQRTAVVDRGVPVSYRELDERSRQLAAVLVERGVRAGALVGLLLPRGIDSVVATLATLRAGATYLPLDPHYPAERISYLLADSAAVLVVSTAAHRAALPATAPLLLLDAPGPAADPPITLDQAAPQDIAYVMYTSGTTGHPKGVQVTHRNVIRLVRGGNYAELSPRTRVLQTGAPVFDATTFELWGPLLNGGQVHLVDEDVLLDAGALGQQLAAAEITTLWLTAALFAQLADRDPALFRPLRQLLVGGDVVSARHAAAVQAACPGLRVTNGYGPTENTTFSTTYDIAPGAPGPLPIGAPIANSTAYVVNADGQLQPVGVPGELWVGGDGLAAGYLGRDELTAQKFTADPFHPGGRVYRTGDLARWRPDGTLDYLGRTDHQVKIRGFRVELGEVESTLLAHPDVREAAVAVHHREPGGAKVLCAYVTSDFELDVRELRGHLGATLPDYMIPALFVQLEQLPLNRNGKLDRAALPQPTPELVADLGGEYVAARDDIERRLVGLWQRVLGVAPIGVTDDFYELGADSLMATMLAADVAREFGIDCPVSAILTEPTVQQLAARVRAAERNQASAIDPAPRQPLYPLAPQQRQIYVEQVKDEAATQYNVPIELVLTEPVDATALAAAFDQVVARHEALRTEFATDGEQPAQRVLPTVAPVLRLGHYPGPPVAEFVRPFDLAAAPLLRAALYQGGPDGRSRLLLDVHHAVADGLSLGIVFDELLGAYHGRELAPVPVQYKDYAHWLQHGAGAALARRQRAHWMRVFDTPPPRVQLPTDFARRVGAPLTGAAVRLRLDSARTAALRAMATGQGVTLFHTLVAAYSVLLRKVTAVADVVVGTPVSGRALPGLRDAVGMFVNTVCLRNVVPDDQGFAAFLRTVGQRAIEAFEHQDYPFDRLATEVGGPRDYARNPLFDTMIALQRGGLTSGDFFGAPVRLAQDGPGQSMFDLNLQIHDTGQELDVVWEYRTALFTEQTVRELFDVLVSVIDTVIADPHTPLGEVVGVCGSATALPQIEFAFGP